ncbi:MAG: JAB domain-containing protein [Verrucomicrobia bacterium]|nr:JAB domain-containing protein [Verrucomicrobiota bacterium]
MSTTEVTSPNESHRCTSPLTQAIEAATQQGARAIRSANQPREWKLVALRECPTPDQLQDCSTPQQAADYWRLHVQTNPYFDPDREFFVVLILNTRRRIKGHVIVGMGILDSVLVHAREVFRVAIVASAHAVILAHNHPAGDPTPSEADIRTTRDLIRAGQLLKIEVLDHIILGSTTHSSLRSLGHWYV